MKLTFKTLPKTKEELLALPEAACSTPFETAALTVLALCIYPEDKTQSLACLDALRGPRPMSAYEKQFIADRFMDADYVPRSYFDGSTPENDYTPAEPYSITVDENPYSYQEDGYATLYIKSGGADSARQVKLRHAKDGKWYLWEQFLLVGIREPESSNPWG